MDPLTHTLLGAGLGYAAFGRRLGRTAALTGGLAALVPDADAFIRNAENPLVAIEYHRHFTHALLFAPVGAALVASLWLLKRESRNQWPMLWICALAAYVSHCLLDAATSYGTQLLWPFTRQRVGWDIISIIDPLFTLTLFIGLTWSLTRRRILPIQIALGLAAAYLTLGGIQHARAVAVQERLAAARGHDIERREVMPTLANNLVWRAIYLHEENIYSDRIRVGWFSGVKVMPGWSLPLVTAEDLTTTERARNERRSFERFYWFSEGWVARHPDNPSVLGDMRYSLSADAFDPIWGIRFTEAGTETEVEWVNRSRQRRIDLAALWEEITGRDPRYHRLVGLNQD